MRPYNINTNSFTIFAKFEQFDGGFGQCEIKLFLVHFVFPIWPKLVDGPFIMFSLICKPIQMFESRLYNKDQNRFIEQSSVKFCHEEEISQQTKPHKPSLL